MRHEFYIRFLLASSVAVRDLTQSWLMRQGTVAGDAFNGWHEFGRLARLRLLEPSHLFEELREYLDADNVPRRPALGGVDSLRALLDVRTAATLADALRVHELSSRAQSGGRARARRSDGGSDVLDLLLDASVLARSCNMSPAPATAREAISTMLTDFRLRRLVEDRVWPAMLTQAMRPEARTSLREHLNAPKGSELRWLLAPTIAPKPRLAPGDLLAQHLGYPSIEMVRTALRQLVHNALAHSVTLARRAAALDPADPNIAELPAAVLWYGTGDYRFACETLAFQAPPSTLGELGFRVASPEEAKQIEKVVDRERRLQVVELERRLPWFWRRPRIAVIISDDVFLVCPAERIDGRHSADLEAALDDLERRTAELPDDAPEHQGGAALLDRRLVTPSLEARLFRITCELPFAGGVFALAGRKPPAAGLALPTLGDALIFPHLPTPAPTDMTVEDGADLLDWLSDPTCGVLATAATIASPQRCDPSSLPAQEFRQPR